MGSMHERGEGRRPEARVSYEEVGNLLSSGGNNEKTALMLGDIRFGEVYTTRSGRKQLNALTEIGILEKVPGGFSKTAYGYRADAFWGHLLAFSEADSEHSLADYFGSAATRRPVEMITTSTGHVVPHQRNTSLTLYELYEELMTRSKPVNGSTLKEAIGETVKIDRHLRRLNQQGIVTSVPSGSPTLSYVVWEVSDVQPNFEEPLVWKSRVTLSDRIHRAVLAQDADFTSADIIRVLDERYPDAKMSEIAGIKSMTSGILKFLEDNGVIKRKGVSRTYSSTTFLTDPQRERIGELVDIVTKFRQQDAAFLQEGRGKLNEILADPLRVAALTEKAQRQADKGEALQLILDDLAAYPQATAAQIQKRLFEGGRKLKSSIVGKYLAELAELGEVEILKVGGINQYTRLRQEEE